MKQPFHPALLYTLCAVALTAALFPLAKMLHRQKKRSYNWEAWYEDTILFI